MLKGRGEKIRIREGNLVEGLKNLGEIGKERNGCVPSLKNRKKKT